MKLINFEIISKL